MSDLTLAEAWAATEGQGTVAQRIALVRALTRSEPAPIAAAAVRKLWVEEGVLARAFVVSSSAEFGFRERWHCRAAYDAITHGYFADFDAANEGQRARMQVYFARLMAAGPEGDRVLTQAIVDKTLALGVRQVPAFDPAEVDFGPLLAAGLISPAEAGVVQS